MNYSLAEMDLVIKELELDNLIRVKEEFSSDKYHTKEFRDQLEEEIRVLKNLQKSVENVIEEYRSY